MKKTIIINDKKMHLVLGKSRKEWELRFGNGDDELWDILLEEFIRGAAEVNENIWYWLIDGRCCETSEEVNE